MTRPRCDPLTGDMLAASSDEQGCPHQRRFGRVVSSYIGLSVELHSRRVLESTHDSCSAGYNFYYSV
jgi:hypothetical protein